MAKVSVIMCVYNGEKVVKRAIDSILNQSYKDIELIIVNDGSKDRTKNIIDESAAYDNRIKSIHKENEGPGRSRNVGIDAASGKYIMFIDADDEYELDMINEMIEKIEIGSYDLVCCAYKNIVYDNNNDIVKVTNSQELNKEYIDRNDLLINIDSFLGTWLFNPLWNKIYRTDIIKSNSVKINEQLDMGEDYCFNIDYIDFCNSVLIFDKTLYRYTLSTNCLTTKFRKNEFEVRKPNLVKLEKFYEKNNINKNRVFFEYIMMSYSCFSHLFNKDNKNTYKENLRYISSVLNNSSVKKALKEFKASNLVEFISLNILKSKFKNLIYFVSYILYWVTKR